MMSNQRQPYYFMDCRVVESIESASGGSPTQESRASVFSGNALGIVLYARP